MTKLYNDLAKRMGYEEAAVKIQDLFPSGKKDMAVAAVPDKLVDEVALVGPADRIRDRPRLARGWQEAPRRFDVVEWPATDRGAATARGGNALSQRDSPPRQRARGCQPNSRLPLLSNNVIPMAISNTMKALRSANSPIRVFM